MRKKIMFYSMALIKGGTERTISNLSNYFVDKYDVVIVTNINHKCEYELDKRVKVIKIDKEDKLNESTIKKVFTKLSTYRTKELDKIIEKEKPDIIFSLLPEPTIRLLSLKKKYNIPMILAVRNHPKRELLFKPSIIRNHFYKLADDIIIQDSNFINYIPNRLHDKVTVIPNYLSDSFIDNKIANKKEKNIVTVARLEKDKNIKLLINAYKELNNKDYKLLIYGDGKNKNKLIKLVNKYNLNNKIIFKGITNNIAKDIKDATLFVLPSNSEGMPNALIEAMSLGLPVISTNSSESISTIIDNNINGIIVEKNNKKELVNKIEYLLNNKDIRDSIGKEAYKIKKIYNKDNIINKWEDLINKYIN